MRSRKTIALITSIGAVLVLVLAGIALRPLVVEYLLIRELESGDEVIWREAANKLLATRSVRGVSNVMETALLRDTENFLGWQKDLFRTFGRDARRALAAYEAGLASERREVRHKTTNALRKPDWRGPEVTAILGRSLAHSDPVVRWHSAYILSEFGPAVRDVEAELTRALADSDETVRRCAARALGNLSILGREAPSALARALSDPSDMVAFEAVSSLLRFGPRAKSVAGALVKALKRPALGAETAMALCLLPPETDGVAPALLEALSSEDLEFSGHDSMLGDLAEDLGDGFPVGSAFILDERDCRHSVARFLLAAGREAGEIAAVLLPLLDHEKPTVRRSAASSLGALGEPAIPLIPRLIERLGDDDWPAAEALAVHANIELLGVGGPLNRPVAGGLARIGEPAVEALRAALVSSPDRNVRRGAAAALGWMHPTPATAMPILRGFQDHDDAAIRLVLASALRRNDPEVDVVPTLLQAARETETSWTSPLLWFLWPGRLPTVGAESRASLPLVIEALGSEKSEVSTAAVWVLVKMATHFTEAARELSNVLGGTKVELAQTALHVLGALETVDSLGSRILPGLVRFAQKADDWYTLEALKILGRLPAARQYLDSLRAIDVEAEKRAAVCTALHRLAPEDPVSYELFRHAEEFEGSEQAMLEILHHLGTLDSLPAEASSAVRLAANHHLQRIRMAAVYLLARHSHLTADQRRFVREGLLDVYGHSDVWSGYLIWELDGNPVRRQAVRALVELGEADDESLAALRRCLSYQDPKLVILAVDALWKLAGELHFDELVSSIHRPEDTTSVGIVLYWSTRGRDELALRTLETLLRDRPDLRPRVEALREEKATILTDEDFEALFERLK